MRSISKPVLELTLYSAAQYFGIAVGFCAALKVEDGTRQGIVSACNEHEDMSERLLSADTDRRAEASSFSTKASRLAFVTSCPTGLIGGLLIELRLQSETHRQLVASDT